MTRGTIVWVDLSDARPPEMGKRRPAVIVSSSTQNLVLDSVVGIPLSSVPPEIPPLRVRVQPQGLEGPSFAVVPGIRQLKKSRILRVAGTLSNSDIAALDKAIRDYLSD
jgi:mRNA-degrading endonuclease toxin of MazEF toxin-antitoxin module